MVKIKFYYFIPMKTPMKKTFENPEYFSSAKHNGECVCEICNCGSVGPN